MVNHAPFYKTLPINQKKWDKINDERESIGKAANQLTGKIQKDIARTTDGVPDAIGVTIGGEFVGITGNSSSVGFVLFTRGPDAGFHSVSTRGKGVGISAGFGLSISQGDHYGEEKNMKKDYGGEGQTLQGAIIFGASASTSLDEEGNVTWLDGGASIGPSVGSSFQVTNVTVK